MSMLDTVNARLAVKKADQEIAKISPLEAVCKSLQNDIGGFDTFLVQKDWTKYNQEHGKTGGAAVLGQIPKVANPKKSLDIGGGYTIHRRGMDTNGNHSVYGDHNGKKFKIQTNGNTPTVHSETRSEGTITQAGADEIKAYHQAYIKKQQ